MRLLLDECLPKDLAHELPDHTTKTVHQMRWSSIKNGRLLRLISESGLFDVFVSVDKNMPHQQKIQDLPFALVILRARSNRLEDIHPFIPELLRRLPGLQPGQVLVLKQPS